MQNFEDAIETLKRSFISIFSICMTVPLNVRSNGLEVSYTATSVHRVGHESHVFRILTKSNSTAASKRKEVTQESLNMLETFCCVSMLGNF